VRLTGRGWGVLSLGGALSVAGAVWRYPGVLGLGGALLLLSLWGLASVAGRTRATVQRTVEPREVVRLGQCVAAVRVRCRGDVEVFDSVGSQRMPVKSDETYSVPTHRRGMVTLGPVEVIRHGVAGLTERRAVLGDVVTVRVLPRVLLLRGLPAGIRRGPTGAQERVERGGTDLVGLREYTPGDDLRRIHWATSARSGTLMVREDADPSLPHLTILLDDRASGYTDGDVEDAVEVAASLAVAALESGNGVRLMTVCDQIDIDASLPSRIAWERTEILRALAEVVARDGEREPGTIPAADRDIVVVVTGELSDLGPLLSEAGRGSAGILSIVDSGLQSIVDKDVTVTAPAIAVGQVTVLRAACGEELVAAWNSTVAG
jgi:uncharacterized protein (DUF58 family)